MSEIPQIEKALNIANQAGLSVEELEELHKEELFLEDRRGEIALAKKEAREEGIIEGERKVVLRLIERRFGELTPAAIVLIEGLNSQDLERLSEAIWDFSAIGDLVNWLEEYSG